MLQDDSLIQEDTETFVVLPLTSRIRPLIENLRVKLPARDRLLKDGHVILEKPVTLGRWRFGEGPLTALTKDEMTAVERGLLAIIGMAGYPLDL